MNTNTTTPVDVLAVMGRDGADSDHYRIDHAHMYSQGERALARKDSNEARAAVAELMESRARDMEVLELAHKRLFEAAARERAKWPKLHAMSAADACADRITVLRAALARCGGAK